MDDNEFLKELATLLFLYRKKQNYTINFLSKETGFDAKFIRNLELGKHSTQIVNYFKLARRLAIPVEEITKILNKYYLL